MAIKLQVTLSNKWVYSLFFFILLFIGAGVYAYTAVPDPGHGADSVVVTVNGEELTLQQAIDQGKFGASSGGGVIWTPLNADLGEMGYNAGITPYMLPSNIPSQAKEVLVYAFVRKGAFGASPGVDHTYTFYTVEGRGNLKYAYKLFFYEYSNTGWSFNSDTFWLPVTSEKKLYVELDNTITGNKFSGLQILGYR